MIIRNAPGGGSGKRKEGPSKQRLAHSGKKERMLCVQRVTSSGLC